MALVNVNFIRVLGDEELLYLWRIFGSAFAIAVKKPCPADGVTADDDRAPMMPWFQNL